jgi:Fatty acid hydroxylase superfamily
MLKSEIGPFPLPSFPQGIDLSAEDRRSRHLLYPVTVLYPLYLIVLLTHAVRSAQVARALGFAVLGLASWPLLEYLVHRHVLHGIFPKGRSLFSQGLHYMFDGSHANHHARPWDGRHINGHLDTLYAAVVAVPLSLLAPGSTVSVWVAAVFTCYVVEEWAHHAFHFWNFKWGYFQYARGRHLYHHSRHGVGIAYGVTSGLWDAAYGTRIPARQRGLLPAWPPTKGPLADKAPPRAADLSAHEA